jgi:hypothetical protein
MVDKRIRKIAESFKSYDNMYKLLVDFNYNIKDIFLKELGTNNYPEIDWMIEYFINKEEYEKVIILRHLKSQL